MQHSLAAAGGRWRSPPPCHPPAALLENNNRRSGSRSSLAMESLLYTVQAEVPDTAATLRLSGMELADCIQEVGALR